jgi:hypothetical protein
VRGVARICIFRSDYGDAGEKKPTGCDHCLRGRGAQIGGFFAAREEKYQKKTNNAARYAAYYDT